MTNLTFIGFCKCTKMKKKYRDNVGTILKWNGEKKPFRQRSQLKDECL